MGTITRYLQRLLFIILYLAAASCYADVVIPNVLGLSLNDAKQTLKSSGLSVGAIQNQRTNRPVGTIIVQAPSANKRVRNGYPVRLVVAIPLVRAKTTKVPNLKGLSLPQAKAAIARASLTLGNVKKRKIKMENEEVLYQSPKAGKGIVVNSKVDITVSDPIEITGPRVKVVMDKTRFKSGESTLIYAHVSSVNTTRGGEYGFSVNGRTHYTKSSPYRYTFPKAGRYIITASFRYARGKWHASLSKTVRVSSESVSSTATEKTPTKKKEVDEKKDSTKVKVPNVIGLSMASAKRAIEKAGLKIGNVTEKEDKSGKKRILRQRPKADKRVKKGSKVSLTKSVPFPKPWQKPNAIISPAKIEITQGRSAKFYSRSTHDKATQLRSSWTSKVGVKSTGGKFKINTSKLKAGRYWVKLSIKDSKNFSDTASAELIILAKQEAVEKADKQIEEKLKTERVKPEPVAVEQQDDIKKLRGNDTSLTEQVTTQKIVSPKPQESIDNRYIEALTIEANNTTESEKQALSSETPVQQANLSSNLKQDKVNIQHSDQITGSTSSTTVDSERLEQVPKDNKTKIEKVAEKTVLEKEEPTFSWLVWAWLLLVTFIVGVLLLILWGYRQRHRAAPSIDYQLTDDAGEQEILMDHLTSQLPLNSIHFNSQVDKGEQQISLDKSRINTNERKKSDDASEIKRD